MNKIIFCAVFTVLAATTHAAQTYTLNTAVYEEIKPLRAKLRQMQKLTSEGRYVDGMDFIKLNQKVSEMSMKANEINKDYWENLYTMQQATFDEIAALFVKTADYTQNVSVEPGSEKYREKLQEVVQRIYHQVDEFSFIESDDVKEPFIRENLNRIIALRKNIYSRFGPLDPRNDAAWHVARAETTALKKARENDASAKLEKAVSAVKAYQVGKLTKDQALLDLGAATNVNTSPNYSEHVYVFQNLPNNQTVQLTLQFDPLDKLAFVTVKKRNSESEGWEEVFRRGQRLD